MYVYISFLLKTLYIKHVLYTPTHTRTSEVSRLNKSEIFFFNKYIYLFLAVLVFIASRGFSSCGERGLLFIAVCGLLIVVASLVEHRL